MLIIHLGVSFWISLYNNPLCLKFKPHAISIAFVEFSIPTSGDVRLDVGLVAYPYYCYIV